MYVCACVCWHVRSCVSVHVTHLCMCQCVHLCGGWGERGKPKRQPFAHIYLDLVCGHVTERRDQARKRTRTHQEKSGSEHKLHTRGHIARASYILTHTPNRRNIQIHTHMCKHTHAYTHTSQLAISNETRYRTPELRRSDCPYATQHQSRLCQPRGRTQGPTGTHDAEPRRGARGARHQEPFCWHAKSHTENNFSGLFIFDHWSCAVRGRVTGRSKHTHAYTHTSQLAISRETRYFTARLRLRTAYVNNFWLSLRRQCVCVCVCVCECVCVCVCACVRVCV